MHSGYSTGCSVVLCCTRRPLSVPRNSYSQVESPPAQMAFLQRWTTVEHKASVTSMDP